MKEECLFGVFKLDGLAVSDFFITSKSTGLLYYEGRKIVCDSGVHKSNIPDSWKQIVYEELVEW